MSLEIKDHNCNLGYDTCSLKKYDLAPSCGSGTDYVCLCSMVWILWELYWGVWIGRRLTVSDVETSGQFTVE